LSYFIVTYILLSISIPICCTVYAYIIIDIDIDIDIDIFSILKNIALSNTVICAGFMYLMREMIVL
jgi:hypothetical protein